MARSYVHRLRVRYAECDLQGHVFNANYFTYFDVALTELWRDALGSYGAMLDSGTDLVVLEATARYRASARFDDEIGIEVTVTDLGSTSMVTAMRVLRGEELLVEGRMVHVFVDRETMRKKPIPDDIREALTAPCTTSA